MINDKQRKVMVAANSRTSRFVDWRDLGVWWDKADSWDEHFAALERYKDGEGRGDPNCRKRIRNI